MSNTTDCWFSLASKFLCADFSCSECRAKLGLKSGCIRDNVPDREVYEFIDRITKIIYTMKDSAGNIDLTDSDWMSILEAVNDS